MPRSSVSNGLVKKGYANYSVQIGVRIRPPLFTPKQNAAANVSQNSNELDFSPKQAVRTNGSEIIVVKNDDQEVAYTFEHLFSNVDSPATENGALEDQKKVYNEMGRPLVEALIDGYNCSFLAYGQTGSGKTYSTMGPPDCPGIIPRFCEDLLKLLDKNAELGWLLEVGYYEIYNEKIHDLLITDSEHHLQLKIREHPENGPYIDGLGCFPVRTNEQIQSWMDFGNRQRATSATLKNDQSSRSHAIFMLKLTQKKVEFVDDVPKEYTRTSCAYLVDLAGSERACTSTSLKETSSINKSLSCLGKVILQLGDKKQQYVNYRDSVLTWLLKEYLGGNAKTSMLVTISPSDTDVDETLSTLRYAYHAKAVVNRACVNEDPAITMIKKLKLEIKELKTQSEKSAIRARSSSSSDNILQISSLRNEISMLNKQLKELEEKRRADNEIFERRLIESRKVLNVKRSLTPRRMSLIPFQNVVIGRPYVALLSGDGLVSTPFLFCFEENKDEITIGADENCIIQLQKTATPPIICCVSRIDNDIFLVRRNNDVDVKIRVNGEDVENTKILKDGDYVNLCNDFYLRIWIPVSVPDKLNSAVEFEKARVQLLTVQNAKLRDHLARRSLELKQNHADSLEKVLKEKEIEINKITAMYDRKIKELEQLLEEEKQVSSQNKAKLNELANRRKTLLIEAKEAQQEYESSVSFRSELLVQIEMLCQKYTPKPVVYTTCTERRRSSFVTVDWLINEANMYLRDWRKQYKFSCEQNQNQEIVVRLSNIQLGTSHLFTVQIFKKKLEMLRELFESGCTITKRLEEVLTSDSCNF